MSKEELTPNLDKAIFELKKEMGAVKKKSKNPFFKSNYADLNQHLSLLEPLLEKFGLLLKQPVISNGMKNLLSTELVHVESGEIVKSQQVLPDLDDMQKTGGAITYARRYTLNSLLAMQAEDDDGNMASGKKSKSSVKTVSSF